VVWRRLGASGENLATSLQARQPLPHGGKSLVRCPKRPTTAFQQGRLPEVQADLRFKLNDTSAKLCEFDGYAHHVIPLSATLCGDGSGPGLQRSISHIVPGRQV
jgi:hypothetical protein